MTSLRIFARFTKLEHTLFSLPMLFAGAYLAGHAFPSLRTSLLIILAGGAGRVVALVLNRIIDLEIDRNNPRTQERHLPSGRMSLVAACGVLFLALVVYLVAAWALSDFCLRWSWVPLVAFTAYPFFKRFTVWTHVGLGVVWSMVPVAGYVAVRPELSGVGPVLFLGLFSVFWLAGFDVIYATQDEAFDREAGLFSLPAKWGRRRALRASGLFHVLAFITLVVLYGVWLSGPLTVMVLGLIGLLLYLENRMAEQVDVAFFHFNAAIGVLVFILVWFGTKGV